MDEATKPDRHHGKLVSAYVPHLLASKLDALAADNGWTRTEALRFAVELLITVKERLHVDIRLTPSPMDASDALAGRSPVRIPLNLVRPADRPCSITAGSCGTLDAGTPLEDTPPPPP